MIRKQIDVEEIVEMEFSFREEDRLFLNGYQSWTDSWEHSVKGRMRGLRGIPEALAKKYAFQAYGDYDFTEYPNRRGRMHGYTYGYVRRGEEYFLVGSLSERNGFTRIEVDTTKNAVRITKDLEGATQQQETYDLYYGHGTEEEVFDEYFAAMKLPPVEARPITGYTTWYDHYENIDEEMILEQLSMYEQQDTRPQVFQIDDGYEEAVGDWLYPKKEQFPHSMKMLADRIRKAGMTPGIWLAPFACRVGSRVDREHPDWIVRGVSGEKRLCGNNWDGFYALDLEQEAVKKYVADVLHAVVTDWGYELLKLDFLYAVCLEPRNGKSRGQLMCEAMDFLREHTEGALLLGCGVPLGAAFGKVDYCRIGCDVSLEYDDVWWMRPFHRERASTRNTIANTYYRRQLDGRAFLNDPDVYLLRDRNMKMTWEQRKRLLAYNVRYGSVLFTSDNPREYDQEKKVVEQAAIRRFAAKKSILQ